MMKQLTKWLAAWRERRRIAKDHREAMAGFEYALSALRDPDGDFREQLQEQADSSPDSPFCLGMQIALNGWKPSVLRYVKAGM